MRDFLGLILWSLRAQTPGLEEARALLSPFYAQYGQAQYELAKKHNHTGCTPAH